MEIKTKHTRLDINAVRMSQLINAIPITRQIQLEIVLIVIVVFFHDDNVPNSNIASIKRLFADILNNTPLQKFGLVIVTAFPDYTGLTEPISDPNHQFPEKLKIELIGGLIGEISNLAPKTKFAECGLLGGQNLS